MNSLNILLDITEIKTTLELTKQAIDGADSILLFYINEVVQTVTRNTIDGPFEELSKHGKDLGVENAESLGDIKTQRMKIMDAFFSASVDINEFFSSTPLLDSFIKFIDGAGAQRTLLGAFHNSKIRNAQTKLEQTSTNLKAVNEKMALIRSQFENKSGENNETIYNLSKLVIDSYQKAYTNIDALIEKLKDEINVLDSWKSQIEKTKFHTITNDVADIRDSVIRSAQKFIADCNEHRTALTIAT